MTQMLDVLPEAPPEPGGGDRSFAKARNILGGFLALGLVIWLLSGIYQVQTGHVAVIDRMGEYVTTSGGDVLKLEHGLRYHLPWPIDRVSIVSTQQNYTLQINAFNTSPDEYNDFKRDLIRKGNSPDILNALFDPYVVTADKSVLHVEINVQFNITDPVAWLQSVSHEYSPNYDPANRNDMRNTLFQQIAQRVIVEQVSRMPLDRVLLEGRAELAQNIHKAFEDALKLPDPSDPTGKKRIDLGVSIQSVSLSTVQVPDAVKDAYSNLVTQQANAQKVVTNARAESDGTVAKAQGETQTLKAEAQAYKQTTKQAAKGEADQFAQVYAQYQNAPALSRIDLWIDAARTVYGAAKRVYFVQPGGKTTILVPPPDFDPNQVKTGP